MYAPIEPYAHGWLPVRDELGDESGEAPDAGPGARPRPETRRGPADETRIYWETCGDPAGKAALVVHGGPGSGCSAGQRRFFDPDRYRVVLFDQRGCGRSTPHAADPGTDMRHNTTEHLLADMERLREHLGVDRWLLYGGSWGSTLILAYAQRHPERVSEIVISGVTMTRREEIDWLYGGVARFLPQEWERFRAAVPDAVLRDALPRHAGLRDEEHGDGGGVAALVAAYAGLMEDPDPVVRERSAQAWCAWEDAVISLEPHGRRNAYGGRPAAARLALVRICTRYFSHAAWLADGALLRGAGRLAGIPGVLIHGRHDLSAPYATAWELARAWPDARLVPVADSGHTGSETFGAEIRRALDGFARRVAGGTPTWALPSHDGGVEAR